MAVQSLDQGWVLREAPLHWNAWQFPQVMAQEGMPCQLPCDVRMALMAAERLEDPVLGANFRDQLWVEQRSWWFEHRFRCNGEAHDRVELTLDRLDFGADIFLNAQHLGRHDSVFFPFMADVTDKLRPGENQLVVRVTCGAETVADADVAELDWMISTEAGNGCPERGDRRRAFLRKPQYVYGWDWSPRIATCGIGGAALASHDAVAVRHVAFHTRAIEGGCARVCVHAEVESLDALSTVEGDVTVELALEGRTAARREIAGALLLSGVNFFEVEMDVPDAALWYPNGVGAQPLYELKVAARCGGHESALSRYVGIRTLELDLTQLPNGRRFALRVNGGTVMCKGGNWIPADALYARVSDDKYRRLIGDAQAANFTMLRIWGGGLYENDVFYELCDRAGILVWQDFMFGCSLAPDHREHFRELLRAEMEHQTRRLGSHACLALFCGNNENQWIYYDWMRRNPHRGGVWAYNQLAPRAVRGNAPWVPYWPSSPYGGQHPNDNDVGDRHHWNDCTMNPDMECRITPEEYDKVSSKFISEYGYIGPCALQSIRAFFDGEWIDRESETWSVHNNTFEKHTVLAGIHKHYVDADKLSLEDYLLYAGATQALMLGYSLEAIRNQSECWGALFWMYNDCWGETGWTIVDYYLRRKPSFYAVGRAFAPRKLVLRAREGQAVLTAHNDTHEAMQATVELGSMAPDGSGCVSREIIVKLPPHSKCEIATLELAGAARLVFARGAGFQPVTLRRGPFREQGYPACTLTVENMRHEGPDLHFVVTATGYAHGVHFDLGWSRPADAARPCNLSADVRLSDAWFDLLPGERREVVAYGAAGCTVTAGAINQ